MIQLHQTYYQKGHTNIIPSRNPKDLYKIILLLRKNAIYHNLKIMKIQVRLMILNQIYYHGYHVNHMLEKNIIVLIQKKFFFINEIIKSCLQDGKKEKKNKKR